MDIIALLGAAGTGAILLELVRAVLGRRRSDADTADVITQAATRAVELVQADNMRLRTEVERLSAQVVDLTTEVRALRDQMADLEAENVILLRRLAEWDPGATDRHDNG